MKRPAFQFYPGDWRKDVQLRACSLAARGLWVDLMCVMHECEPYGHLTLNGMPMTPAQVSGQIGVAPATVKKLLDELLSNGVARTTPHGVIFSKRMVDDEKTRNARAEGGKAGAEHGQKGAEHGKKGGRPAASKGGSETPLEDVKKPPPSSSSSSSTSNTPPTPKGGKSATTLKTWLQAVREAGEKPVPEDDPVHEYAEKVGLPHEFLALAWVQFKHRYGVQHPEKRYRDWRRVFRNAVEGNWLKLWYVDPANGQYGLTTVGLQAKRANEDRSAA